MAVPGPPMSDRLTHNTDYIQNEKNTFAQCFFNHVSNVSHGFDFVNGLAWPWLI